jgi:hypothetical protein
LVDKAVGITVAMDEGALDAKDEGEDDARADGAKVGLEVYADDGIAEVNADGCEDGTAVVG